MEKTTSLLIPASSFPHLRAAFPHADGVHTVLTGSCAAARSPSSRGSGAFRAAVPAGSATLYFLVNNRARYTTT